MWLPRNVSLDDFTPERLNDVLLLVIKSLYTIAGPTLFFFLPVSNAAVVGLSSIGVSDPTPTPR